MGRYLLVIRAPGHHTTHYPVHITRQHHWQGIAPDDATPRIITLPPEGTLSAADCYVPAGWMIAGGGNALSLARHLKWVEGFVMRRYPVTNAEYIAFLNGLVDSGSEQEALRLVPRGRAPRPDEPGRMVYGRDASGHFTLVPDAEGVTWAADWPVVMVRHDVAMAYAAAQPCLSGAQWELPTGVQWEKAARGVDGRRYPWGDYLDPSFLNTREHGDEVLIEGIKARLTDVSPYGVRGMAGNVRDWTAGAFTLPGGGENLTERGLRGGCYFSWANTVACRVGVASHVISDSVGFRMICRPDWIR